MLAELAEMKRARRQPDGADQQVRQRLHRGRRRRRDDRPADQQRQLPQHRLVPADADVPVEQPARAPRTGSSRPTSATSARAASSRPPPSQDAIFGAIWKLFGDVGVQPAPIYPAGPHCNQLGLSPLGERLLSAMIDSRILFDPDHMSVAGRNAALDYLEQQQAAGRPPGVVSSHSWSTPDAYPRIYRLGGFVAPYAGDSTGFVEKWRQHLGVDRPALLLRLRVRLRHERLRRAGRPARRRRGQPGDVPLHRARRRHGRPAAQRRAGLRHQHRRRRPLRHVRRLGGGRRARGRRRRRRRSRPTWAAAPRPTSRPGSGRGASRPTRAATPACAGRCAPSPGRPTTGHAGPRADAARRPAVAAARAASSPTARGSRASSAC